MNVAPDCRTSAERDSCAIRRPVGPIAANCAYETAEVDVNLPLLDRDLGHLNWADSAPGRVALGKDLKSARKTVIPLRAASTPSWICDPGLNRALDTSIGDGVARPVLGLRAFAPTVCGNDGLHLLQIMDAHAVEAVRPSPLRHDADVVAVAQVARYEAMPVGLTGGRRKVCPAAVDAEKSSATFDARAGGLVFAHAVQGPGRSHLGEQRGRRRP